MIVHSQVYEFLSTFMHSFFRELNVKMDRNALEQMSDKKIAGYRTARATKSRGSSLIVLKESVLSNRCAHNCFFDFVTLVNGKSPERFY